MSETAETPAAEPEPEAAPAPKLSAPLDDDLAAGYVHTEGAERLSRFGQVMACVAIVFVALVCAVILAKSRKKPASKDRPPTRIGVRVASVSDAPIQPTVLGLGRARPRRRVAIATQVAGIVSAIHPRLESGAILPAGAIALEIDRTDHQSAYDQLRAQLAGAEADQTRLDTQVAFVDSRIKTTRALLELEEKDLARIEGLNKRGIANDRELSVARLSALRSRDTLTALLATHATLAPDLRKTGARVSEVQALLTRAQADLDRCIIRVPFRAQVAQVAAERHQLLSRGQVVFEAWQIDQVEVPIVLSLGEAHLFARDLTQGGGGAAARVVYESRGESLTWSGRLKRFEPVDGDTQTVKAVIEVENARQETPLAPDLFCKVTLQAPSVDAGLVIPSDGLRERNRVYVVRDKTLTIVRVVTGRRIGNWIVIKEGLKVGEQVITSPLERAIEGTAVEIVGRDDPAPAAQGTSK